LSCLAHDEGTDEGAGVRAGKKACKYGLGFQFMQ
jgi:hypothetical protein